MSIQIFLFADIQWSSLIASLEHRLAKYHFYILFVYFYIIFFARMNTLDHYLVSKYAKKYESFDSGPYSILSLNDSRMTQWLERSVRRYLVGSESTYEMRHIKLCSSSWRFITKNILIHWWLSIFLEYSHFFPSHLTLKMTSHSTYEHPMIPI